MSEMTVLLLVLAGTVAVPAFAAVAVQHRKKHPLKDYDERQKLAQGEAYDAAFWMMVVYFLVLLCIYGWQGMVHDAQVSMGRVAVELAAGLIFALRVHHTYCFLTHAALPLNKKPLGTMLGHFLGGILGLLNYYLRCWWYPDGGEAVAGYLWLLMGVDSSYLGVLYLLEWLRHRKEAQDGEE